MTTADPPTWDGDLAPLLRWLGEQGAVAEIELACGGHGDPGRGSHRPMVVAVPGCVGQVHVTSYLELAAAGVERITVRTDACPRATDTAGVLAEARKLLGAVGCSTTVAPAPPGEAKPRTVYDLRRLPLSRRRLFMLAAPRPAQPRAGDGTERGRAIEALQSLRAARKTPDLASPPAAREAPDLAGPQEAPEAPGLAELPAACADLAVSGCTMCGVCVRACDGGALTLRTDFIDDAEVETLRLLAASCTDCGRCVRLCPQGAITRRGTLSWSTVLEERRPRVLARTAVRHCQRCHAAIRDHVTGELCELCSFRQANPFGTRLVRPLAPSPDGVVRSAG